MLILTILKIIGICFLIILCFLLILLAYILFVPVSYRVSSDFNKKIHFIRINDKIRLIFFKLNKDSKEFQIEASLLFRLIKLIPSNKKDSDNTKTDKPGKKNKEKEKKKKDPINLRIKRFFKLVKHKNNKIVFKLCLKEILEILKKLQPKEYYASIDFCTGSPDTTGYITAALALIPFVNTKDNKIFPDFSSDTAYINGVLKISGYLRLIHIITAIIRIYSNKHFKVFLKRLKK